MKFQPYILVLIITCLHCLSFSQNHLQGQSSPYLKQHVHNPIDWYPWGSIALGKAAKEKKLLIVSIGYASCHWCHVMEKESFSDTAVSAIMNKFFINIKVDREERPDIDQIYLNACQLQQGASCGWPLNIIALPDGKPVFITTYNTKAKWTEAIQYFYDQYNTQPDVVNDFAIKLASGLKPKTVPTTEEDETNIKSRFENHHTILFNSLDKINGGVKGNQKFPLHSLYEYLLAYGFLEKNNEVQNVVYNYIHTVSASGLHDVLEGGWSRYSTDSLWQIPHFEKMLYDQAQWISLLSHTYQITKSEYYKSLLEKTVQFVEKNLKNSDGTFYASLDADMDGDEGKYYVWTKEEIETALQDPILADSCIKWFDIKEEGNAFNGSDFALLGKNVLSFEKNRIPNSMDQQIFSSVITKLKDARSKRVKPTVDTKIITAWNALLIQSYAEAYMATGNNTYKNNAIKTALRLWNTMWTKETGLYRIYADGKKSIAGTLDDYSFLGNAYIRLYHITLDKSWLYKARDIKSYAIKKFASGSSPLFKYSQDQSLSILKDHFETADQGTPSSNASFARLIYSLATYFDYRNEKEIANKMIKYMLNTIKSDDAYNYGYWLTNALWLKKPPYEIGITGKELLSKHSIMIRNYMPQALWYGTTQKEYLPVLKDKYQRGSTMIYVCQNNVCLLPVSEVEEALKMIK